jgi:hypothetical protein
VNDEEWKRTEPKEKFGQLALKSNDNSNSKAKRAPGLKLSILSAL